MMTLAILFALNFICTGCGDDKVRYISSESESEVESENKAENEAENDSDTESVVEFDNGRLEEKQINETLDSVSDENDDRLAVYVCGAVNTPGVYYFEPGDIKSDALEAAGGLTDGASLDYVNLAGKLQDGERLYFPYEEEVETGSIRYETSDETGASDGTSLNEENESQVSSSGKVNINTADKTALMNLPGIGESKAELIINYRESNGAFSSIEDIMNINGIKDGVYGKIKDYITVD
jgi:competence protein ComEA